MSTITASSSDTQQSASSQLGSEQTVHTSTRAAKADHHRQKPQSQVPLVDTPSDQHVEQFMRSRLQNALHVAAGPDKALGRQFLVDDGAAQEDAAILMNPTRLSAFIAGESFARLTSFELSASGDPIVSICSMSGYVCMPGFCVNGYTCGAVVYVTGHGLTRSPSEDAVIPRASTARGVSMGKYVRNERTGEVVMVVRSVGAPKYGNGAASKYPAIVSHIRHTSMTRREVTFAACNALDFSYEGLLASVSKLQFIVQTRPCPMCRAPPCSAGCQCKASFVVPQHPLDFPRVRANQGILHWGCFEGEMVMGTKQLLPATAVEDSVHSAAESGPRARFSAQYMKSTQESLMAHVTDGVVHLVKSCIQQRSVAQMHPSRTVMPSTAECGDELLLSNSMGVISSIEDVGTPSSPVQDVRRCGRKHPNDPPVQAAALADRKRPTKRQRQHSSGVSDDPDRTCTDRSNSEAIEEEPEVHDSGNDAESDAVHRHGCNGGPVRLPAPYTPRSQLTEQEIAAREEARRQKNRAAAARSNAARKARQNKLSEGLAESKARVQALQQKQSALLQSVATLRRLVEERDARLGSPSTSRLAP